MDKKQCVFIQWLDNSGNYASGENAGRKLAETFLKNMGSGQVAVYNSVLPSILNEWQLIYENAKGTDSAACLVGQKDGFLRRLSEFLVVAAYTNNYGLCTENAFDPARVAKPEGFKSCGGKSDKNHYVG